MTMKMISTTSITSTIGVTLISDTGGGAVLSFMKNLLKFPAGRRPRYFRRPTGNSHWESTNESEPELLAGSG
jgi:hypothetical protein